MEQLSNIECVCVVLAAFVCCDHLKRYEIAGICEDYNTPMREVLAILECDYGLQVRRIDWSRKLNADVFYLKREP